MDFNSERSRSGTVWDCGQNAICVPHVHRDRGDGVAKPPRPRARARAGRAASWLQKTFFLLSNCIQGPHTATALFGEQSYTGQYKWLLKIMAAQVSLNA